MAFLCIGVLHFALRRSAEITHATAAVAAAAAAPLYLSTNKRNSYKIRIHKAKNMRACTRVLCDV